MVQCCCCCHTIGTRSVYDSNVCSVISMVEMIIIVMPCSEYQINFMHRQLLRMNFQIHVKKHIWVVSFAWSCNEMMVKV